jgi:hypothetical protein
VANCVTDQAAEHGGDAVGAVVGSRRRGCSADVYHMLIIKTKPGFMLDSRRPRRNRFAAVPAKEVHAGVVMRIIPQPLVGQVEGTRCIEGVKYSPETRDKLRFSSPRVQNPRNFAMGRRWRRYPAGSCPAR